MAVIYDSAKIYIESAEDLCDKITRIDAVITALEDTLLTSATTDNITEYSLDDGQTKIKTAYKGTDGIMSSINSLLQYKQLCVNRLNGRQVRLVDSKSFRIRGGQNGNF